MEHIQYLGLGQIPAYGAKMKTFYKEKTEENKEHFKHSCLD